MSENQLLAKMRGGVRLFFDTSDTVNEKNCLVGVALAACSIDDQPGATEWISAILDDRNERRHLTTDHICLKDRTSKQNVSIIADEQMPVPMDSSLWSTQSANFIGVRLVVYQAEFDLVEHQWFVDIDVETPYTNAFVRLSLVRYQPCAPPHTRVSEPICQWTQVFRQFTIRVHVIIEPIHARMLVAVGSTDLPRHRPPPVVTCIALSADAKKPAEVIIKRQLQALQGSDGSGYNATFVMGKDEFFNEGTKWTLIVTESDAYNSEKLVGGNHLGVVPRSDVQISLDELVKNLRAVRTSDVPY